MVLPFGSYRPWLVAGGVVTLTAVAAALTNPTPADYQAQAATEINGFLLTQVCPQLLEQTTMAPLVMEACQDLEMGEAEDIERYIAYHTRTYNLGVATLFVTEFPIQPLWSLGIFGQIVPLPLS
ncbi:DUF4359 domain-containing protein [Thermosynechococcaceae cyanobacterium Okahandja]